MEPSTLYTAHAERVAGLDPLLPVPEPLAAGDGYALFTAETAGSAAAGVAKSRVHDPATMAATWGALRRHTLSVRATGPEPAEALDGVLHRWEAHLRALVEPGDQETSADVTIPSRDTALIAALTRHGFAPMVAVSVRPIGDTGPAPAPPGVTVRPMTGDDLDAATELYLVDVHYDAAFRVLTVRPGTAAGVRTELAESLDRERPGVWLAELDGVPVGLIALELPPVSDWVAPLAAPSPVAYLGLLAVRPEHRGRGIGSALASTAHRAAAEHGAALTMLHHIVPNPLSTPFWFARGYRPLWTTWQRRPAVRPVG